MAEIQFNLRGSVKSDDKPVQMIYRLDSDRSKVVINTKIKAKVSEWNYNTSRFKKSNNPYYLDYNQILNTWEIAAKEVINRNLNDKHSPTKEQFKKQVLIEMRLDKKSKGGGNGDNLIKYFENFIEQKSKALISPNTIKTYNTALYHIKNFQLKKLNNKTIQLNDVDKEFMLDFLSYLFGDAKLMNNSVVKVSKNVRAVLNEAHSVGLLNNTSYKHKDVIIPSVKQPKVYLNKQDIAKVLNTKLTKDSKLDKVRDRLIVQIYTGLRVGDLRQLNKSHIQSKKKREVIVKVLEKTTTTVTIPLKSIVVDILKKHNHSLPVLSDQKYNQYLKDLCKVSKINEQIVRTENKKQVNYSKDQLITSHTLRRSFATNALLDGIPLNMISTIMGHASISETNRYICMDQEGFIDDAFKYDSFN